MLVHCRAAQYWKKITLRYFFPNNTYCEPTIQAKVNNYHSNDINKFTNKQADKKATYVLFQKLERIYVNRKAEQVFK